MKNQWALLLGSVGLGAGLMYLLDPDQGRRRRALVRDQAFHAARRAGDNTETVIRDLRNRTSGVTATTSARLHREHVSDDVLVSRVRAALGRASSHPHAIQVTVTEGDITLSGPILAREVEPLLHLVSHVRGVRSVENQLEIHQKPGDIPGLQGEPSQPIRAMAARRNWPPATRFLAGATGGSLALFGLARRDTVGTALGLGGLALLTRAATNLEFGRLLGVEAGRRAIDLRKTLNIAAPLEEVFQFCTQYQNFPRFMQHVREVRDQGAGRSHWIADGPVGIPVSWDAEVTECIPNEVLAWKSVPGSTVPQAGIMRFEANPDGTTRLDIRFSYNPPAGALGHAVATLFGANPKQQMDEDFARLKSLLEVGKTSVPGEGEVRREELAA